MKVYAPNREYAGVAAGIQFAKGVAEVDEASNQGAMAYFRRAGYGIGSPLTAVPAKPPEYQPERPAEVALVPPSLDAAVQPNAGGPVSDAFLPPTNAGHADPHGPLVVSPGLHAVPPAPIRPGEVYVDDVARQEREETELAERTLVAPVEPATIVATMDDEGDVSDASDGRPAQSATKADWVAYAVTRGIAEGEAEDLTKAQIQERLGTS